MNSRITPMDALRYYLLASTGLNLLWEILQIPLYTISQTGTNREIAFAILHCTAGDAVIATSSLVLALVIFANRDWPASRNASVNISVVAGGLIYTIFSERINIAKQAWAYSDLMPIIPSLEVGLAPALQWLIIPIISLWIMQRRAMPTSQ